MNSKVKKGLLLIYVIALVLIQLYASISASSAISREQSGDRSSLGKAQYQIQDGRLIEKYAFEARTNALVCDWLINVNLCLVLGWMVGGAFLYFISRRSVNAERR